jgi:hypothetical protein
MKGKAWRVIWYDADGHEIESEDFEHQNLAQRKMARVREERLGSSVKLYTMRQTEEATAAGFVHDGWDLVDEMAIS